MPPFEHADIIAGQGTCGLEIINELQARGVVLDDMLVNCSGGGLTAGVALAFSEMSPKTKVHSVEPEGFDDYARSLRSGVREKNASAAGSICDALLTPQPGEMTFAMNKGRLAEGYVVSEAEVRRAVRFAFETLKLVVEPGGAVGLAAVLSEKNRWKEEEHRHHPLRRQCRCRFVCRYFGGCLGGHFRFVFFHQGNFRSFAGGPANDDHSLLGFA